MSIQSFAKLAELENIIERGMTTFIEVGQALLTIRDDRLYHEDRGGDYDSFDAYLKNRWGFTRQRAHQLMQAAEVALGVNPGLHHPDLRETAMVKP